MFLKLIPESHSFPAGKAALSLVLGFLIFIPVCLPAGAQEPQRKYDPHQTNFSFHVAPIYQSSANLDKGGGFSVTRYWFRADVSRSFSRSFGVGLGLAYEYDDYDFSSLPGIAGSSKPWSDVHRFGISFPLRFLLTENWHLMVSPSIQLSCESSAKWEDGIIYGGFVSVLHRFGSKLMLGVGAGVYSGLEEVSGFPFLMINWQISEKFRLSNPFNVSPAGPAGLELSYRLDRNWEIGTGAAYRSYRFRLDQTGYAADGIGKSGFVPLWARISRKLGPIVKLDIYAGAAVAGELTIENQHGTELAKDSHDTTAIMALTLSAKF